MIVPTLIVVGDEDDHCLQPGIFLKKTIPALRACWSCPRPATRSTWRSRRSFNQLLAEFIAQVEAGRWLPRDPRARCRPRIMKTIE